MASYLLPEIEGDVIPRGWSQRRAAALAKRSDAKDTFTLNAVRGAHIRVERAKTALLNAAPHEKSAHEDELALATQALEEATAAHEAYERGDADAEEASEPEGGEGEEETETQGGAEAPTQDKRRRGGRR